MAKTSLKNEELWKKVEEDRLREEQRRTTLLAAFRATKEELEIRATEDASQSILGANELLVFGEGIARSARRKCSLRALFDTSGFLSVYS